MRMKPRKLLIKYNYSPNKSEEAVQTVIRKAEKNCKNIFNKQIYGGRYI